MKEFATVINCMDGRVQEAVNSYVKKEKNVKYVDTITFAGPCKVISELKQESLIENLKFRLDISINKHGSSYIAIVGHFDCAGVPLADDVHKEHILTSYDILTKWYPNIDIEALWVNNQLEVIKLK